MATNIRLFLFWSLVNSDQHFCLLNALKFQLILGHSVIYTVPANSVVFAGTVLANSVLFAGTVLANSV